MEPPQTIVTPRERIAIVEAQIDRLRKEVDDRMSSNHTLWRAGIAGIGALILLKETLDLSRLGMVIPLLGMVLAAHWINQTLTFFRAGDAMAVCERKINLTAGEILLMHELSLARSRVLTLRRLRWYYIAGAVFSTGVYWWLILRLKPLVPAASDLPVWEATLVAAAACNLVAAGNLWRLIALKWVSLSRLSSEERKSIEQNAA